MIKSDGMTPDFFDPTPEEQRVVLVDGAILCKVERLIESCEGCNPDGAEIPFDNILDRVTGSDPSSDPSVTDYGFGTAGEMSELPVADSRETLIEPA
jgi:hypothetical protein